LCSRASCSTSGFGSSDLQLYCAQDFGIPRHHRCFTGAAGAQFLGAAVQHQSPLPRGERHTSAPDNLHSVHKPEVMDTSRISGAPHWQLCLFVCPESVTSVTSVANRSGSASNLSSADSSLVERCVCLPGGQRMTAELPQPFNYSGHDVHVVMIDGEPWFVLADLCRFSASFVAPRRSLTASTMGYGGRTPSQTALAAPKPRSSAKKIRWGGMLWRPPSHFNFAYRVKNLGNLPLPRRKTSGQRLIDDLSKASDPTTIRPGRVRCRRGRWPDTGRPELSAVLRVLFGPGRFGRMRRPPWRSWSSSRLHGRAIRRPGRRGHRAGGRPRR